MTGFDVSFNEQDLAKIGARKDSKELQPLTSVRPGQHAYVIEERYNRFAQQTRWGLVPPFWMDHPQYRDEQTIQTIRQERLHLPCWDNLLRSHKAIIPMTDYYIRHKNRLWQSKFIDEGPLWVAGFRAMREDTIRNKKYGGSWGFSIITTIPSNSSPLQGTFVPMTLPDFLAKEWLEEGTDPRRAREILNGNHRAYMEVQPIQMLSQSA